MQKHTSTLNLNSPLLVVTKRRSRLFGAARDEFKLQSAPYGPQKSIDLYGPHGLFIIKGGERYGKNSYNKSPN